MNIRPAQRLSDISEYYFSRKLAEVARLNAEGRDIISLGIGGPDRPPHPTVTNTLAEEASKPDTHGYMPTKGHTQLRRAFADFYRRHYGVKLDPDTEIQPLIGSKEGILHISLAFLDPGDEVLVPNPGYPTYTSAPKLAGATVRYYDLVEEREWLPDFDALDSMPLEKVKVMMVNYPHMPTGTPADMETFRRIVDFGRRHNILIVNDNPYSFILNDRPLSILSVPGAKEVALEMNSLSKSHNMPGWRMGMVAGDAQLISWLLKVKSNVDSGQYLPMQRAAANALALADDWYRQLNEQYARRRAIAEQIMTALGCTFRPEQRGLFLWGRIPDEVTDVEVFTNEILYGARVFITPGFIFGSNGRRYVRISLCADEDALSEALIRIKEHLK